MKTKAELREAIKSSVMKQLQEMMADEDRTGENLKKQAIQASIKADEYAIRKKKETLNKM